jgi:hypothetical protein
MDPRLADLENDIRFTRYRMRCCYDPEGQDSAAARLAALLRYRELIQPHG